MIAPKKFILPDLVSHCSYPLLLNQHCEVVARASEEWLLQEANFSEARRTIFYGLKAGELTAACYPHADAFHLQVASDFMGYLFTLDDWSDQFNARDTHGLADNVMSALHDPSGFQTDKAAGKLAKWYVSGFLTAVVVA